MSDPFIGEIRAFAFTFYPSDYWLPCDGRTLAINQYPALYSIIGNYYGPQPNPQSFVLPNLIGTDRTQPGIPLLGVGKGATTSTYTIGQQTGVGSITLKANQLPPHRHTISAIASDAPPATYATPEANTSHLAHYVLGSAATAQFAYSDQALQTPLSYLDPAALQASGNPTPQAYNNRQPCLAFTFAIAVNGYYPVRP